ncbi:hypothetical protein [Methylomonas sp. MK1]|uniref:hypothetical protein n=1 Tax=Methylomonas sp. MK1 TaxID=1131552 RepID=UPI000382356C|nr:hypothetical protein [Methylomonas sp. MK1]
MKSIFLNFNALFVCTVGLFASVAQAQNDVISQRMNECRKSIIPLEIYQKFGSNYESAFRDAMCGKWYTEHEEEAKNSAGGGIDVLIVSASGSADSSKSQKTVSRIEYCQNTNYKVRQEFNDEFWRRSADPISQSGYNLCIHQVFQYASSTTGSYPVKISVQEIGEMLQFSVRFDANFGGDKPRLKDINPARLRCSGKNDRWKNMVIPSQGDGIVFECRWATEDAGEAIFTAITTRGDVVSSVTREVRPYVNVRQVKLTPEDKTISTKPVCGDPVNTPEFFHNWKNHDDGRCAALTGDYCLGKYGVALTAEKPEADKFVRLVKPYINCNDNANGSCNWNGGNIANAQWTTSDSRAQAELYFGSHQASLKICAEQQTYSKQDREDPVKTFDLPLGGRFTVSIPKGEHHKLNATWRNGISEQFNPDVGNRAFQLETRQDVGNQTLLTYKILTWEQPGSVIGQQFRTTRTRLKMMD